MKNLFAKLLRMLKNPAPYIEMAWFRYAQKPIIWPTQVWWYRKVILPRLVKKVAKKEKIKVLFLAMSVAYWKYDTIYRRMAKDDRFDPIIMPAMRTNQSFEDQLKDHDELMIEFSRRGYNIVPGYDKGKRRFIAPQSLGADIVFYTHPYSGPGRLRRKYDFWAMRKSLICYVPYFFQDSLNKESLSHPIQLAAWRNFYAYDEIKNFVNEVLSSKGGNVSIVGYCSGEEIQSVSFADANASWGNDNTNRKRIIWAPHHSIDATDQYYRASTFLEYAEEMKSIANTYRDRLIIAFKPHPVLYSRLVVKWGREKVDAYYNFWKKGSNTLLQEGEYLSLFKGSDAMIHDSSSFKNEYIEVDKPCMFLFRKDVLLNVSRIGQLAVDAHYAGRNKDDIICFIENVVLKGDDYKASERRDYRNKYLTPPNGKTFSENVIDEILKGLGRI